ncbi:MAG: outer membrane beta-barrel protein [Bacteroidota bacterium]
MFNKKILFSLSLFIGLFIGNKSTAQTFYGDVQLGYSPNFSSLNPDNSFSSAMVWVPLKVTGSFGKGWNYGVTAGYFFNDFFGFEMGVNQFTGNNYSNSQVQLANGIPAYTLDQTNYGSMFKLCPALKFSTFDGKIKPYDDNRPKDGGSFVDYYAKIGLDIGIINNIYSNQNVTYNLGPAPVVYNSTIVYSGGSATGFNLKLGATFKQNDHMFLWAEIAFVTNYFSPDNGSKTGFTVNGVNRMDSLTVSSREINFVDIKGHDARGTDKPSEAVRTSYSFNSIGINVGIEYRIPRARGIRRFMN